eukprot:7866592-Karenia_brevis.AAC.1
MARVLQEMESGGKVEAGLIASAHTQMTALFQGLTTIASQCEPSNSIPAQKSILSLLGATPQTSSTNATHST